MNPHKIIHQRAYGAIGAESQLLIQSHYDDLLYSIALTGINARNVTHSWDMRLPFYLVDTMLAYMDNEFPPNSRKANESFYGMIRTRICYFIDINRSLFILANSPFTSHVGRLNAFDVFTLIMGGHDDVYISRICGLSKINISSKACKMRVLFNSITFHELQKLLRLMDYVKSSSGERQEEATG